ncbi:hypothetical protein [Spiroplasma endosymbiont of Nomada rufipes]|uniref:hypothetical protein n=1 Tax=Spiroplasma endosymbiont of Nomada rufipes TaxID=3077933 RepID=UPI00376EC54B
MQIQCENKSEEEPDEHGRAYCKEHRIKVDEINKSRHKNCINKEKLINRILDYETLFITNIQSLNPLGFIIKLRYEIEDGEFDDEKRIN